MSKLSFRARALDASKPMPVFRSEEVPDLPDFAAINRAVPQMPTGMEKEEECEHHLQRAMSAQQAFGHTVEHVIPTPEVFEASEKEYDDLYPANYKISRQLIHMQLLAIEQDIPEYDMDSEDETWLNQQQIQLSAPKFEEIMDRLERSSGQHVVTLKEAKLLLKEDDDLIIAVYDYWLNKRLKTQHPLIPFVKTEKRDGSTSNNPYVAFRRRTEKMQTRKNRKNDETSYEKMLKLRRDLSRAVNLLDLIKHREKTKHEHLKLNVDIFEKRYQMGDFSGQILNEVSALRHIRPSYMPNFNNQMMKFDRSGRQKNDDHSIPSKRKREYRKRPRTDANIRVEQPDQHDYLFSSDEESASLGADLASDQEEHEDDPDGSFAFRRKKGCTYHAPLTERLGNWPWCAPEDGGLADKRYRYCLTSISRPNRCIGFARRRVGRGGRVILDRAYTPLDDYLSELDEYPKASIPNGFSPARSEYLNEIKSEWLHFRPRLAHQELPNSFLYDNDDSVEYDDDGNAIPVVPITSLKEFIDDGFTFNNSELDYATFQSHQEELFEMQRKQLERLKSEEVESSNLVSKCCNNMCNSNEHSSRIISCASPLSSTSSTSPLSTSQLDPASVEFAVSAVLSASEFSNRLSDGSKDLININNVPGRDAQQTVEHKTIATGTSTNGPIASEMSLRKTRNDLMTPSPVDAQEAQRQDNSMTSTPNVSSNPLLYKLKCQTRSQNNEITTKTLHQTDVT